MSMVSIVRARHVAELQWTVESEPSCPVFIALEHVQGFPSADLAEQRGWV